MCRACYPSSSMSMTEYLSSEESPRTYSDAALTMVETSERLRAAGQVLTFWRKPRFVSILSLTFTAFALADSIPADIKEYCWRSSIVVQYSYVSPVVVIVADFHNQYQWPTCRYSSARLRRSDDDSPSSSPSPTYIIRHHQYKRLLLRTTQSAASFNAGQRTGFNTKKISTQPPSTSRPA